MTATEHFAARLRFETDPADVAAERPTLVDVRSREAYAEAHIPGAISLPWREITAETAAALPPGPLVTYCWSPACNAATKGALRLAEHGREVREMLGGIEYWKREDRPVSAG